MRGLRVLVLTGVSVLAMGKAWAVPAQGTGAPAVAGQANGLRAEDVQALQQVIGGAPTGMGGSGTEDIVAALQTAETSEDAIVHVTAIRPYRQGSPLSLAYMGTLLLCGAGLCVWRAAWVESRREAEAGRAGDDTKAETGMQVAQA